MRGMAFEVSPFQQSLNPKNIKQASYDSTNNNSNSSNEPISVLDNRRSPSPSTSTSTHSSFNGGATTTPPPPPVTDQHNLPQKWPESLPHQKGSSGYDPTFPATVDNGRKDDWPEFQPIPADFELQQQRFGVGLEDWENLLSESAQDQSLRWISGDIDDSSLSLQQLLQSNPNDQNAPVGTLSETNLLPFGFNQQNANLFAFCNSDQNPPVVFNNNNNNNNNNSNLPPPVQVQFQYNGGQKGAIFNYGLHKGGVFQQNVQRCGVSDLGHEKDPVLNVGHEKDPVSNMDLQKVVILNQGLQKVNVLNGHDLVDKKPLMVVGMKQEALQSAVTTTPPHQHHQQYQLICDQLFAAAELTLSGNFSHAQGILARLNHQFASAPAPTKPFHRAAFYFKEALQMQSQSSLNLNSFTPPFNGLFKMGAYKMFSEVSPIIQFMNFTSNQTLLEALGDVKNIHIIDFDIGFGAQWASFIQELPTRNNGGSGDSGCTLKITAFASPSTHNPIELGLMHENLSQFAQEIGISFELEVVNFDSFDPRSFSLSENATIAVNLPIWSASTHLSAIPSILHFVKQLSPTIVVSFDRGCERTDIPFPHYLLQGVQYYELLLDSIDGANVVPEISNKMERFLFQPQIERMVSGKLQFPEPMPHWKTLFTAGGYSPVLFSNFAETQADCVVKRMQVQGFHIEKKQASLVLCWQNRELMTASAWKC